MIDPTAHYAALIRLQVCMSALQQVLWADCLDMPSQIAEARDNARVAVQIALGAALEVPPALMRDWADNAMKRDAKSVLAATTTRGQ